MRNLINKKSALNFKLNKALKIFLTLIVLSLIMQSCTATKKDCRGKTKHRLPNGIYM